MQAVIYWVLSQIKEDMSKRVAMEDRRRKMHARFHSILEAINSTPANPCKNTMKILRCAEEYSGVGSK